MNRLSKNKMKGNYYYFGLLLGLWVNTQAQCIRGISTNPQNPVNSEFNHLLNSTTTINPWLNTFDWGSSDNLGFLPIVLEPNGGWQIPDFTGTLFTMKNPFFDGGSAHYPYLYEPVSDYQARDFHWEDGWELLWLGTGYYPNGEAVSNVNPNRLIAYASGVESTRAPYIILYNRYRGVMRIFVNVFAPLGQYENAKIELRFLDQFKGLSGNLRLVNGSDQALDKNTSAIFVKSQQAMSANITQWMSADFQMAYDPCVCDVPSQFKIEIAGSETFDIDLYGRGVSLNIPIADPLTGRSTYDQNFLSVHAIEKALDASQYDVSQGQVIYHYADNLIEDYQKRLLAYNRDLKDYNSVGNSLLRLGLDGVKDYLKTGIIDYSEWATTLAIFGDKIGLSKPDYQFDFAYTPPGLTPTFPKELGSVPAGPYFDGQQIPGNNFTIDIRVKDGNVTMRKYEHAKIEKDLRSNAGKLLSGGFEYLSLQLFPKALNKPVRPSTPTASFSEMRFSGTIVDSDVLVDLGPFLNPGSYKQGMSLTPYNYPAYDEAMGSFAMLRTPSLSILQEGQAWEFRSRATNLARDPEANYTTTEYNHRISLKLNAPLEYKLNAALDIDPASTTIYGMLEVEFESLENYHPGYDAPLAIFFRDPYLRFFENTNGNLNQLHGFRTNVGSFHPNFAANTKVFSSKWYPVKDLGEVLFDLNISTGYHNYNLQSRPGFPLPYALQEPSEMLGGSLVNKLKSVKLKLIVDMGFMQVGYDGEQVRNTQVYTYELFDSQKGVNELALVSAAEATDFRQYAVGEVVLDDAYIKSSSPQVFEISGNDLIVKAEEIKVYGNITVEAGKNLVIEAVREVNVHPQARLPRGTVIRINENPYAFPDIVELTEAQVRSFCQDQQNGYRANFISAKQAEPILVDTPLTVLERSFKVYPNPSSGILQVEFGIASKWLRLSLHDLKGRIYLEEELAEELSKGFELDLTDMGPGVYILQIQNAEGEFYSERILKL